MVYKLGRLLQLAGLVILPFAIAGNLARPEENSVGFSLTTSAIGIGVFTVGWLLQQGARPR